MSQYIPNSLETRLNVDSREQNSHVDSRGVMYYDGRDIVFFKDKIIKTMKNMIEVYPKNVCISEKEKLIRTVAIIKCIPKETSSVLN